MRENRTDAISKNTEVREVTRCQLWSKTASRRDRVQNELERHTWRTDSRDESCQCDPDFNNRVFVTDNEIAGPSGQNELGVIVGVEERFGALDKCPTLAVARAPRHSDQDLIERFAGFRIVDAASGTVYGADLEREDDKQGGIKGHQKRPSMTETRETDLDDASVVKPQILTALIAAARTAAT